MKLIFEFTTEEVLEFLKEIDDLTNKKPTSPLDFKFTDPSPVMSVIRKEDLRLGNWFWPVSWKITHPAYGLQLTQDIIDKWEIASKSYKPIPLTSEWLKKFGFVESADHEPRYIKNIDNEYACVFRYNCDNILMDVEDMKQFRFVHELQNWYFKKHGKELEIAKPEK